MFFRISLDPTFPVPAATIPTPLNTTHAIHSHTHSYRHGRSVCVEGGGVQVPPVYNESGSTCITLNWLREYPEYHNGGAPVIGARVLMRPATHHDWTAEHVYGYAAPDPAAPKARPARVAVFWDGGRAVIGRLRWTMMCFVTMVQCIHDM